MSLATRCPYCSTTFRVTHDQLKLRGGLVRCGSCKEIFNGVEHLLPATPAAATAVPPPIPASLPPAPPTVTPPASDLSTTIRPVAGHDQSDPNQSVPAAEAVASQALSDGDTPTAEPDPLTRMTLMDIRPYPHRQQDQAFAPPTTAAGTRTTERESDDISQAIADLQGKPWRAGGSDDASLDAIDALDNEEPEFVRRARIQQARASKRRVWLAFGSVLLALLALLQAAFAFRTPIAAQWPATMPVLTQLCSAFGCTVGMPMQIEFITIESHELQAMPASDNTFTLGMLLRNRSDVAQTWPHLQLTLNNAAGEPVARRVLAPAQYLRPQDRERGFAAKSEKPVRVIFALDQLSASGYLLYAFYP
ncbi:DUF3426 domain-containing protein [Lacisediminimonas sp.]|uniref:DUF3426 domain-containing protein n=1 Tax=Lacisediminimonas sp. TaxID=3060582 RepID=UPI0027263B95|nr:DUF3426 domain-containing protein [Lacisediminimonas sp.]MDO8298614.1 DUF3426 domain-containing protein [Lacisediminimonas sp.]MDO9216992.1 DUF3426 domain-containing protein [Lacisediminimonas sp.]